MSCHIVTEKCVYYHILFKGSLIYPPHIIMTLHFTLNSLAYCSLTHHSILKPFSAVLYSSVYDIIFYLSAPTDFVSLYSPLLLSSFAIVFCPLLHYFLFLLRFAFCLWRVQASFWITATLRNTSGRIPTYIWCLKATGTFYISLYFLFVFYYRKLKAAGDVWI